MESKRALCKIEFSRRRLSDDVTRDETLAGTRCKFGGELSDFLQNDAAPGSYKHVMPSEGKNIFVAHRGISTG